MGAVLERELPAAVGDICVVGRPCLGNPAGARAVVVEVYQLPIGEGTWSTGWSLLFENGNHDGFSAGDCDAFDVVKLGHEPALAWYPWTNAIRLYQDWRAGVFACVWAKAGV